MDMLPNGGSAAPGQAEAAMCCGSCCAEGRHCEPCRHATANLLLPHGTPSAWLLLLAAACANTVLQAMAARLA